MTATRPMTNPSTYTVEAYNLSHASENKIHDDSVAKKLGFTGGLVPGVEVFAYMTHLVVGRYGRDWLERGRMEARFLKPLYDGHMATVTATGSGGGLDLKLESDGVLCATGSASLGDTDPKIPGIQAYERHLPPANRPPASEASLAEGTPLATQPFALTEARLHEYLKDVRETHDLYAREGLVHPGLLLRLCNSALRENVVLAPWIHTGSKVRNFAVARIGDELSARGRVVQNYEKKGHRLVDLDVILVANDKTVLAHVLHTAVYKLRHLAEKA